MGNTVNQQVVLVLDHCPVGEEVKRVIDGNKDYITKRVNQSRLDFHLVSCGMGAKFTEQECGDYAKHVKSIHGMTLKYHPHKEGEPFHGGGHLVLHPMPRLFFGHRVF
jgi:hypothetical protein